MTFEIKPARYAKNSVAIHCSPDGTGLKTRAMRLAQGVGGRWTHREGAYIVSPAKAERFRKLYASGADYSPITKTFSDA